MSDRTSLQQILDACLNEYTRSHTLLPQQYKVLDHIQICRTEALGGLRVRCEHCADEQTWYHACRDRHCPLCQRKASEAWRDRQLEQVLEVTYYHVVFTLPHQLNAWIQLHDRELYTLLFATVWSTLNDFGQDPRRLDGQIGMSAVLHTWGQTLSRHVHLHCLVPGGALGQDGRWHPAKGEYLFPVRALSAKFRGAFVSGLRQLIKEGKLHRLSESKRSIDGKLSELMGIDWNVYAKACINRTETVVNYLSRYTHRIAVSNGRLSNFEGGRVDLDYKDWRDERWKTMRLEATELIRRFVQHILPKGFMRIRHFGLLANRCRAKRLEQARQAIAGAKTQEQEPTGTLCREPGWPCPKCKTGLLWVIEYIKPVKQLRLFPGG